MGIGSWWRAFAFAVALFMGTGTPAWAAVEPDAPTVSASASGTTITANWAATGTGDAPIDGFEVTIQQVGEPGTPVACSGTPSAFPGLFDGSSCTATGVPGTSYEVAVRAHNEAGFSLAVAASVAVVPAAPTVTMAVYLNTITVDWSATGRHPETIDGFEVTITRAGSPPTTVACSGTAASTPGLLTGPSCTAPGSPGASYEVAVRAHNGAGFSAPGTASVAAVASGPPSVTTTPEVPTPGVVAATPDGGTADAAGAATGLPVTGPPIAPVVLLGLLLIAAGALPWILDSRHR